MPPASLRVIATLAAASVATSAMAPQRRVTSARRVPILPLTDDEAAHSRQATGLASPAALASINFTRQSLAVVTGETVLTDVHIRLSDDGTALMGMAVGERGIVFTTLQALGPPRPGVAWPLVALWDFPFYAYGVHMYDDNSSIVSGFVDGSGESYGFTRTSTDSGMNWTAPHNLSSAWGSGPIKCSGSHCAMLSIDEVEWTSTDRGSTWSEQPMPCWLSGSYYFNASTLRQAGCDLCTSTDYGAAGSFTCVPPPDAATGIASGYDCSGRVCVTGGGEIDPIVHGWTYISHDGGATWGASRALDGPIPIRTVLALSDTVLIAAGGNIFTGVGGIYTSKDAGVTWSLDVSMDEEVKACDAVTVGAHAYVYCVTAGTQRGSVYAAQVAL